MPREAQHLDLSRAAMNGTRQFRLPHRDLVIGLLSVPGAYQLRELKRKSYLDLARHNCKTSFVHRFILSIRESFDSQVLAEAREKGDLLFVDAPVGFDFISHKVKLFLNWALDNFRFNFLFKADDDDTFCIKTLCTALPRLIPGSPNMYYFGRPKLHVKVILDPTLRQYNPRFKNETGMSAYPTYMGGAGYAVSYAVAERLGNILITDTSPLPFRHFPREDVTFGYWITGLDNVTRVKADRQWLVSSARLSASDRLNRRSTGRYVMKGAYGSSPDVPGRCFVDKCGKCGGSME